MREEKDLMPENTDTEQSSPAIEISLDKSRYHIVTRRVGEDGEIYLERVTPAEITVKSNPLPKRKIYLKNPPSKQEDALSRFPLIEVEAYTGSLLNDERILWHDPPKAPVRNSENVKKIASFIAIAFGLFSFYKAEAVLLTFAVLAMSYLFFLYVKLRGGRDCEYAVTNKRLFQDGADLPISRILGYKLKRHGNNTTTVILKVQNGSRVCKVKLRRVSNADKLVELLAAFGIKEIKHGQRE